MPDTYLFPNTETKPRLDKKPGSRERLHSEAAYIAFYLFVIVFCVLPTYGVFAKLYARLADRFQGNQETPSAEKSPLLEKDRKNLAWQWGWMILGDLVKPKDDNLYLRRKIYLAGCLLAMLCLSLPVWLISAIPLRYSDYRERFTNIDQWLILLGFIFISLVVFLHLSGLWVIFCEVVFHYKSGISLRVLVYLSGGALAILCLTLPVWLILISPPDNKRYWESFTTIGRKLILGGVVIAALILVCRLLQLLWTGWKRLRQEASARQKNPFKILFSIVGQQVFGRKPTNSHRYRKGDFVISAILVLGLPLFALILLVGCHFLPFYLERDKSELILLWERTVGNFSGISPLLPLALIATGTLTWALCCLRRLRLLERKPPSGTLEAYDELKFLTLETNGGSPSTEKEIESEGISRLEQRLHKMMDCPLNQLPGWFLTALSVGLACWIPMGARLMPSVEGLWFNRGITALFILAYLAIALNFLRFLCIWAALRRLLRRLSWHPLLTGYRHPKEGQGVALDCLRLDLSSPLPTFTTLTKSVKQARLLSHTERAQSPGFAEGRSSIEKAWQGLNTALNHDASNNWAEALKTRNQVRDDLIKLSEVVATIIRPYWIEELRGGSDHRAKQPEVSLAASSPNPGQVLLNSIPSGFLNVMIGSQAEHAFLEQSERFLVSRLIGFLQYVLAQMQNLVVFVTVGILLMLGAVLSYPFQPMSPLLIFNWVTIIGVVSITMLIFVQMNRNPTLSLLSGTKPGELEWNSQFILQVVVHGLLPLLAITGAQFSDSLHEMMTWLGIAAQGSAH